jgi:hypothetical protein
VRNTRVLQCGQNRVCTVWLESLHRAYTGFVYQKPVCLPACLFVSLTHCIPPPPNTHARTTYAQLGRLVEGKVVWVGEAEVKVILQNNGMEAFIPQVWRPNSW